MGKNRHKKSQRHIWLRAGNVDVDITASQFSSTNTTMFAIASSEWHKRYNIYVIEVSDSELKTFNRETKAELLHDYKKILIHIEALAMTSASAVDKK